jgi:hypothetical protein
MAPSESLFRGNTVDLRKGEVFGTYLKRGVVFRLYTHNEFGYGNAHIDSVGVEGHE